MTFKEKCSHAEKLVESKKAAFLKSKPASFMDFFGVSYTSRAHRLLWLFGFEVPPPHFLNYKKNRLYYGVLFGIFWGSLMMLMQALEGLALIAYVITMLMAAIGGIVAGHVMAKMYQTDSAFYQIPLWEDFHPEVSDPL